ncbi:MAG: cell division protein ZapA [Leptonema sp. (in: Bacteria)]|nr:cell division protein ZapA [Leptonema sp. (in: bacteria)]
MSLNSTINRLRVDIFGEMCTVRGEADPDYIASLARIVDERMRELATQAPTLTRSKLALLVALNLADELTQSQIKNSDDSDDLISGSLVAQKTRYLIDLLDEGIVGDTH